MAKNCEPVLRFSAQIAIIRIVTKWEVFIVTTIKKSASIAQLVEQLFCKQQVVGSSPSAGSFFNGVAFKNSCTKREVTRSDRRTHRGFLTKSSREGTEAVKRDRL